MSLLYEIRYAGERDTSFIPAFWRVLNLQRDYFLEMIQHDQFPKLGIYTQLSAETSYFDNIYKENSNLDESMYLKIKNQQVNYTALKPVKKLDYLSYPVYPTIVSLDYESGKLYAGFTQVPFLQDEFFFIFPSGDTRRWYRRVPYDLMWYSRHDEAEKGELYLRKDTAMRPVSILSSQDIELHYKNAK